ncbi:MAG TPA: translation initiation factor IF-2 [Anaerolineae bacterium]|nr:translation initiation factor IF-2 [Anaerolineae bacterium]HID85643.1 translation initiation factor IF-2 [Anaerolineales bacterium]HIQ09171.1 translation initiation factor IF-2 [Anaerolineaceae bacterium]
MAKEQVTSPIELPASLTVRELAEALGASPIQVIKTLMDNGVMASINQRIDFETAEIVAADLGYEVVLVQEEEEEAREAKPGELPLWRRLLQQEDPEKMQPRPPVVAVLGHVDHGKTSLLDAIRKTNVAAREAGGITQHIGAYQIVHQGRRITFLDTPGHAAFTAMRARGAQGADIVVLVVAADDGVMPQTREAINHAKAAQVPIVVALNKIDKPNANPDRVKQQLAEVGLVPDEYGGDTIVVPVSAKERIGLDDLLEAILLVADSVDLKANPEGLVFGTVIEARREKGRGVVATLLVQNGTLKVGHVVVAGTAYAKVRAMFDDQGKAIREAGPSMPALILGFSDVPAAGELFRQVSNEKEARQIVEERREALKHQQQEAAKRVTLEDLFKKVQEGEVTKLYLVLKVDVYGSLEPVLNSIREVADKSEIDVEVLHADVGPITESDVNLAAASKGVVIGFNVRPDAAARRLAAAEGVSIRTYNIIYRLTEDLEKALRGMLGGEEQETLLGKAQVLAVFKVPKVGKVAGCRVLEGVLRRNALVRVRRGDEVLYEGQMSSLKHEKEDVREIRQGFECGVGIKGFQDFQEGDIIECYVRETVTPE